MCGGFPSAPGSMTAAGAAGGVEGVNSDEVLQALKISNKTIRNGIPWTLFNALCLSFLVIVCYAAEPLDRYSACRLFVKEL